VYYEQVGWLLSGGLVLLLLAGIGGVAVGGHRPGRTDALGLVMLLWVLLGGALLAGGGVNVWRAIASTTWPVTRGVVVANPQTVIAFAGWDSDGMPVTLTRADDRVLYTYDVAGQPYVAMTRHFGEVSGGRPTWKGPIVARYPVGAEVRVAYAPAQPEQATLEPGLSADVWILPGLGAAVWLFVLAFWGVRRVVG
jgi:hypothetical protein